MAVSEKDIISFFKDKNYSYKKDKEYNSINGISEDKRIKLFYNCKTGISTMYLNDSINDEEYYTITSWVSIQSIEDALFFNSYFGSTKTKEKKSERLVSFLKYLISNKERKRWEVEEVDSFEDWSSWKAKPSYSILNIPYNSEIIFDSTSDGENIETPRFRILHGNMCYADIEFRSIKEFDKIVEYYFEKEKSHMEKYDINDINLYNMVYSNCFPDDVKEDLEYVVNFGPYKGKKLSEIIDINPKYIIYLNSSDTQYIFLKKNVLKWANTVISYRIRHLIGLTGSLLEFVKSNEKYIEYLMESKSYLC